MAGAVTPEEKNAIVDFLNSKAKTKSKFYFNDFLPLFPDKKPREVKKILTALIDEEVLEYWSSGSTTMYGLKGAGKFRKPGENHAFCLAVFGIGMFGFHCRHLYVKLHP